MTDVLARLQSSEHAVVCPCTDLRKAAAAEIEQLRGTLSLAEEGLANYAQENERLQSILAQRLQELDDAKWLIRNGEKHFGSLWRDATAADIMAVTRRPAVPQSEPTK